VKKRSVEKYRKMTFRQKKYRHNRMMGMNMYNAAKAAGYSEGTAVTACVKLEPRAGIADIFDQAGATDKALAQQLAKIAFTATKLHNANIVLKQGDDGKLEVQDTNDFIEVDDNFARLQAIKQICELKKHNRNPEEQTGFDTYFVELIRKHNAELQEKGIDGFRITKFENRALDRFVPK